MKKQTLLAILAVSTLLFSMFGISAPVAPLSTIDVFAAPAQVSPECGSDPAQVGCWLFNEGIGTTAADGSGNLNTGTLVGDDGTMWVADRFGNAGKALHFNGNSQYVKVADANSLDITGDITIAAWVKPDVVGTQDVVKKAVTTGTLVNGYEFDLATNTGTTCAPGTNPCAFSRFNQAASTDTYRINSMTTYTATDPWTYYVITYSGAENTLRIYRDGTLSNSRVVAGLNIAANSLFLGFGAQLAGTGPTASRWFNGSLDDIRLYKRALSAAEIKALFNNTVPGGFTCSTLQTQAGTASTGEKPMSKAWSYSGKWWSVFPASSGVTSSGAWLWRLDGMTWTPVLKLSSNTSVKADVKPAGSPQGSVVHVLLYNGSSADLVSVEYNAGVYQTWSLRSSLTSISLPGSETATIDIDSSGRLWLGTQRDVTTPSNNREIIVYPSDSPYIVWNSPITLATGTSYQEDISAVVALSNNTMGVLWSNQNTKRFGFKVHKDSDPVATWSVDELPASQSANDSIGTGMADDHLNMAAASDGTLYAAVKTGYDTAGYPKIALLVRRLSGTSGAGVWDNLYGISESGTRAIALLDETAGTVTIIYTSAEGNGNILYRQTAIQPIAFGAAQTMRSGANNDVSSTKQMINGELVAIYSNGTQINGSSCTVVPGGGVDLSITKTDNKTAAIPGEATSYTLVVNNGSASALSGVTVTDAFPAVLNGVAWTCTPASGSSCTANGSGDINDSIILAANGSVTYTANATIVASASGSVVNTASVSPPSGVSDPNTANNSATDSTALRSGAGTCGSDPDLVACYQFDESSGNVFLDGVQNTVYNDGLTVDAPLWVAGKVGQGLNFNGSTQYGYTPNESSLNVTSAVTLAAWIRPGRTAAATQRVIAKTIMGSINGYELSLSSAQKVFVRFNQFTSADTYRINSTTNYPLNYTDWMHVAATYNGVEIRLYINGFQEGNSLAMATPIVANNVDLGIGTEPAGASTPYRYQGDIDDVRIYKRALSASEILALSSGSPPPAAPSGLTATLAAGSQIDLAWTDNSSNETGFEVEVAPGPACTAWSSLGSTSAGVNTFRHWNTTVYTQYCYRVRANSSGGDSAWSNTATASTPVSFSALSLGRDSSYVRFPGDVLHLKQFTIETWFRREGAGVSNTTGTGGILQAIPLVAKGSAEAEGTTQDENFLLVIDDASDVLAADFEECDNADSPAECPSGGTAGLNHPILGITPININTWYHAAVTYDGAKWQLFLNGNLERELVVGRYPRWDNISPIGLGTSMTTGGTAQGFFNGTLDEVRIWNYARSQSEIRSMMNSQIADVTAGLSARWSLDEASGTAVNGSAGTTINGSIYPLSNPTGWNWTQDAPFNATRAPELPISPTPTDSEIDVIIHPGGDLVPLQYVELETTVSDPDSSLLTANFYGRPYCPSSNFTLAVLPDTQYYSSQTSGGTRKMFDDQTQWIVDNRVSRNILYTTHLGDIVDLASDTAQWDIAGKLTDPKGALTKLDDAGMKYGLTVGNHDGGPSSTANFNNTFPFTRVGDGHYGGDNDNQYGLFSSGSLDFIVINLEYNASPDANVLAWADNLLSTDFPNRRGILVFHNLVESTTALSTPGQVVYDALKHNPNLFLMLGGHADTEITLTLTDSGHTIYALRSDYQTRSGGNGWMRLMEFQPLANQIQVYTYSPFLNQWETDASSQFVLAYDMGGSGCEPFQLIQTVSDVASGSRATVLWGERNIITEYEWFVTVNDGVNTVSGPTWMFMTQNEPTAVSLIEFSATASNQSIQVSWKTTQEVQLVGFNLFRAENIGGTRLQLNPNLLPAKTPGRIFGNPYQYQDASAEPGRLYYYWIEIINTDGEQITGPVSAVIAHPYKIWLPSILR